MIRRFCFVIFFLASSHTFSQSDTIEFHDNIEPAGNLSENTLSLDLKIGAGMWFPGGEDHPGAPMWAFGESGGPLLAPGPLLRVVQGTEIHASVFNGLSDQSFYFHGFHDRPGDGSESLLIGPGSTEEFRFVLNEPGVYFYWADSLGSDMRQHSGFNGLLSGVIVVDPPGMKIPGRFFVVGESSSIPEKREHGFNGRSFPNTERMEVEVGETSTWHFINTTFGDHPLHLHGTFFRVTGRGTISEYRRFEPDRIYEEVTAQVAAAEVMTMEWHTERPGNWLFHCHVSAHVAADSGRLSSGDDFQIDPEESGLHEMGGMTLAITARSPSGLSNEPPPARQITMNLEAISNYLGDREGIATSWREEGEVLQGPVAPGPILVLEQDEPASITILNKLHEATSIHWHGMELQSYYDGVAGFSGVLGSVTPAILPGGSFVARMTPPRAGTYIYHTHMDDRTQLIKGLYGALIVASPEYPFHPDIDRVFVMGLAGDAERLAARVEGMVINGERNPVMVLQGVREYRLRLINITANNAELEISLVGESDEQVWNLIGKDGAQLPDHLQQYEIADRKPVSVGETYDYAWTPPAPGTYWLEVKRRNGQWMGQARLNVIEN